MYNPWKGLAAYEEPQDNSEKQYLFCGRDEATRELTYLIENQLCVTLYGRTGIGKTSLLQAGIFPRLRKNNYLPILVRLGIMPQDNKHSSYAGYITQRIKEEIERFKGKIKQNDCTKQEISPNATDYLWAYFATRHFFIQEKEVFPVIVLDQFEENFINHKEQVWLLLEQIYSLIDDNKLFPDGFHNETIFRIVISIREDDLYRLEDSIDNLHLPELKSNRYRLTRLTEEEAQDIITHPGSSCLPHDTAKRDEITNAIIAMVKKWNDGSINTLALSLSCSILYDKAADRNSKQPILNLNDIYETESNNPLIDFYATIISSLPQKERYFLEDNLVDENGRRNTVNSHVMDSNCPHWHNFLTGTYRILQENNNKVELVHDMLANAIYEARLQREKKRQNRFLQISIIFIVAIIFLLAILGTTFDITGKDPSRLPVFPTPKVIIDANDTMLTNYTAKEIVWNGANTLNINNCLFLKYITITHKASRININNCPNLQYIIFIHDSIGSLRINNCPSLKYLNIPHTTGFLSIAKENKIRKISLQNNNRYTWLDDILWDIKDKNITYLSNSEKREAYFPYEMKDSAYSIYHKDTIYNRGLWIDHLLFNKDTTCIINSHNPIGPVLDLTRYPNLQEIATNAIHNNSDIKKIILNNGIKSWLLKNALANCQELDTIVIPAYVKHYSWCELNIGKKTTYIIDSANIILKKVDGIIYNEEKPVLLSAEYKNDYLVAQSFNDTEKDSTIIFISKEYYCEFSNKQCNEYGIRPNININDLTKCEIFHYIKYQDFTLSTHKNEFGTYHIYNNSNKIILPPYIDILDCTNISPNTKKIYILRPASVFFINLNDSIQKNITLYTAYGMNSSLYDLTGFESIREASLIEQIQNNIYFYIYETKENFLRSPWLLIFAIILILAIGTCTYISNIKQNTGKYKGKKDNIINSLKKSIITSLFAIMSWIVSYWLLRIIFGTSEWANRIGIVIGATLFALAVILAIDNSLLYAIRNKNRRLKNQKNLSH